MNKQQAYFIVIQKQFVTV